MAPESDGLGPVVLEWRSLGVPRTTEVRVVRRQGSGTSSSEIPRLRREQLEEVLGSDPGVSVVRVPESSRGGVGVWWNWELPGAVMVVGLVLWAATIGVLVNQASPKLATKWAWWWLSLIAAPAALVAFLIFGAPRTPGDRARRLTGGWGFLLMLLL